MRVVESYDTKTVTKNGLEYDVTVARRYYCYLANNPMWNRFAKRSLNKRMRAYSKAVCRKEIAQCAIG